MFCIELNYQTLGLVNEMLYIECGGDYQLPTLKKGITGSLKGSITNKTFFPESHLEYPILT